MDKVDDDYNLLEHPILSKLEAGEEFFPLRGNDRATPIGIRMWAHIWLEEIRMNIRPESDRQQVTDGLAMASRMEIRLRERDQKREHDATEFDEKGVPLHGPHRRMNNITTSGVGEI